MLRVLSQAVKLSGIRDFVKLEHVYVSSRSCSACSMSHTQNCFRTSAEISPSSLIQQLHGVEPSSLPKKIDYCLYMRPNSAMERRIEEFVKSSVPFGRSINQTDEGRNRQNLPLVSIKVAKSLSQEDPLIPLSLWASAGLERAAELFEKHINLSDLVPTILVCVKGPHWSVMFMNLDDVPIGGQPTRVSLGAL